MNNRHLWQLKRKIKILGAILELPTKQHSQFSLFTVKMGKMDWIGSSVYLAAPKWPPQFFQLPWGPIVHLSLFILSIKFPNFSCIINQSCLLICWEVYFLIIWLIMLFFVDIFILWRRVYLHKIQWDEIISEGAFYLQEIFNEHSKSKIDEIS